MESFEHALPAGTLIDERYRIDSVLGEGGFAITYKAFDTKLQCDVAIKEFLPVELAARSSDTKTVQPRTNRNDDYSFGLNKFLEEARTLAQLQHPHIVQVTNFIEAHGTGYLVMTYAEGQELGEWLKTQPGQLSEEAVLGIITPIIEGLTRVHQQGLLHRDIKPGNIFLRNVDGPMLIDFGAARQAIGEKSKSISAIISQGYAPTEQYTTRGKQGPYTDLYAIGATLYRLITGQTPVDATDRSHAIHEGDEDPLVPAIVAGKGKVSDWLLALTDQLLNIVSKNRPQSAQAVLDAIKNKTTATIDSAGATTTAQAGDNKTRVIKDAERFSKPASQGSPSKSGSKAGLYGGIAAAILVAIGAGYFFTQQSTDTVSENSKVQVAATEKPEKELAQGRAILSLDSNPSGAEVFLDNNLVGKTPYRADNLAQGIFELKLTHESSNDLTESLQLTDNIVTKKTLTLTPAMGNFSVVSEPEGAKISVDGKATGKQTPASLTDLTVGEHELLLTKDAYYPKSETIYVRKGETLRGDFTLEGGHLVKFEGKWMEPEEKRQAEHGKAEQFRQQAEADARKGKLASVQKTLQRASQLAKDEARDAAIISQAKQEYQRLEKIARAKAKAEAERQAELARLKAEEDRKAREAEAARQAELTKKQEEEAAANKIKECEKLVTVSHKEVITCMGGKESTTPSATVTSAIRQCGSQTTGHCLSVRMDKGNCTSCHQFASYSEPWRFEMPEGLENYNYMTGPPLVAMRARFPDKDRLYDVVYDASKNNPATEMPRYGAHGVLTREEIKSIVDYLHTL